MFSSKEEQLGNIDKMKKDNIIKILLIKLKTSNILF